LFAGLVKLGFEFGPGFVGLWWTLRVYFGLDTLP
jgi:hypothetical protein